MNKRNTQKLNKMMKYPRTSSSNSSGFFDEDEAMDPYHTPPQSPYCVPPVLQRHIVRMFSTEDASGTSAVAIDNKIEQAMDLVKSHLMIAVREEVEVLKEKISELMDKINQLEVENTILKSNMTQETLQQLQMQTQLQIAGSAATPAITAPPSTNNTSVVVAATAANVTTNGNSTTNTTTANATSNGVTNATAASAVPAVTTPTSGVAINALQQQLQQQTTPVESAIGNTNVEAEGVAVNQTSAVTTNGPLS